MRLRPALLLPALLAACSGDPADTTDTGTATSNGDSSDATTTTAPTTTQATQTTQSTDPTATGEPQTTGTDDVTTTPVTDTADAATDPATTRSDTTDTSPSTDTGTTATGGTTDTTDTTDTGDTTGMPGDCTPGATQPCYSGPPGTLDVGLCSAGEQVCTPRGEWGPCLGEVLPAQDDCLTPGDESCDGVDPCGGTGTYQWDHEFGSIGKENGLRIAFDGAGNVVLAASSNKDIDLGGGILTGAGGFDVILARFAPDGAHLWSKRYGDAANQFTDGYALHVDATGEIVLSGDFEGKIDFGGGILSAQSTGDLFLVKLTASGQHVWSKAFPASNGYAVPGAVTRDKTGNILLGGYFLTGLDLGGGVLASAGLVDAFVGKFDADGKHVWSQRFGDAEGQYVLGLVTDLAGNVFMTGGFQGKINPGNGALVSAGNADIFLARLDPKGTAVWGKRFGDPGVQVGRDLAIDAAGHLVITGETEGSVDFGGGAITVPSSRGYVAQYDSNGAHQWSHIVGNGDVQSRAVAYDGPGQLLLTGNFSGSVDFGGGPLASEGSGDIFALKLDNAGKHVWSKRFGDFQTQIGFDIAGSTTGNVAITGQFQSGVNFGGGPSTSKGDFDIFIAAFGP